MQDGPIMGSPTLRPWRAGGATYAPPTRPVHSTGFSGLGIAEEVVSWCVGFGFDQGHVMSGGPWITKMCNLGYQLAHGLKERNAENAAILQQAISRAAKNTPADTTPAKTCALWAATGLPPNQFCASGGSSSPGAQVFEPGGGMTAADAGLPSGVYPTGTPAGSFNVLGFSIPSTYVYIAIALAALAIAVAVMKRKK